MNSKHSIIAIATAFCLLSCKEELQPQADSSAVRAEQNQTPSTPKTTTTQNTQNTQTTPAATTTQAKGPVNPAHGQPGHRCDIAVGAPLNNNTPNTSQAPAVTNKTATPQNVKFTPQMTTTQVKTAKGMNPPHGQPGHRCDISVGAPLNSKPNTTTTTTNNNTNSSYTVTPSTPQGTTPSLLTPTTATPAASTATAPGMNPPHGQPGHVCGIAVGAPLDSQKKEEKKTE